MPIRSSAALPVGPRHHWATTTLLAVLALGALGALQTGCTDTIEIGNLPGRLVTLGPVWAGDDTLVIPLSVWDDEGDPVGVTLLYAVDGGDFVAIPATSLAPGNIAQLPATRRQATAHALRWTFADQGLDPSQTIRLRGIATARPTPALETPAFRIADVAPAPPEGSEPEGSEPEGSEPEGSEPEGSEPEGSEPDGSEPDGSGL